MLRRLAPALCLALVAAGCGSEAKQSAHTLKDKGGNQPAPTTTAIAVPKGTSGVVHMKTSLGSFAFELAPLASPRATRSFARLIRKGFFDGLTFHRIVAGFIIQGGDPNGSGTGGPGYLTHDTVAPTTTYPLGAVAMAKTEREAPGTAGSQFFIVTAPQGVQLCVHPTVPCGPKNPPAYALIGHVVSGMKVVLKIGRQLTDPTTQRPLRPVVMQQVTLTKR
jgi:cyclophilin family peptidyl-prolyl cis-trans isomerase